MARIVAPKQCLIFNPSLLVLPLLTLDEVLEYNGGPYSVLSLAPAAKYTVKVFLRIFMNYARLQRFQKATTALASFVQGNHVAWIIVSKSDDEINKIQPPKQKDQVSSSKGNFKKLKR
jgi:hypothetical protein